MALILRCASASRRLTSGAMTTLTCSPRAAAAADHVVDQAYLAMRICIEARANPECMRRLTSRIDPRNQSLYCIEPNRRGNAEREWGREQLWLLLSFQP
jgi:hypothetical protein